ncbi:MAG: pilin [Firmicutes bacterium]|nr:pilin [Bacillota bacterium]
MTQREEGFTLVELMIVVVVIGILAGIAVPMYSGVQKKARQKVGDANALMLNRAIETWEFFESHDYDQERHEGDLLEYVGLEEVLYVEWGNGEYVGTDEAEAKIPKGE